MRPRPISRSTMGASLFFLTALVAALPPHVAGARPADPAERGLDLFVHAAPTVISGDSLALDLRAYGFSSVAAAGPLPNAAIVAAWDPESLGPGVSSVPGDVTTTTDRLGEARLDVPVPTGDARKLVLLVALRHGEHVRTRKIDINRTPRAYVELRVAESSVVPGSRVPAWIIVTDARTGGAVANAAVDVALLEGEVDRWTEHLTTDATGLARASFSVPESATGSPPLSLRARLGGAAQASVALGLREETPAMPRFTVRWKELQLKPAEVGHAEMRLVDAADEPIAGHPVVYWVGPKGTSPPANDEQWKKNGVAGRTDGFGQLAMQAQAPRVVTSLGSDVTVVARTEVEGQKLEERRTIAVGQAVATAELSLEGGAVVPGLVQQAYLHVSDGEHGVAGEFTVEGDGLRGRVTTDADGHAELSWTVPEDVGARRDVGPCAGGVAASIIVRQARPVAALSRHPQPFELCVNVARDRATLLRTSVQIARIGDKLRATSVSARRAAKGPGSVVVTAPEGFGKTFWTNPTAPNEAEIDLANMTPGVHTITLAVPQASSEAETNATRILVLPRVLPKLTAKLGAGKLAPGGEAEVDVVLDDGHGAPITGSVTAVVIDKEGGGSLAGLDRLDTRIGLCDEVGAPREHCDAFLEGHPSMEVSRRRALTTLRPQAQAPLFDPTAQSTASLKKTFSDVLHSLEGAVFQAQTPESLRDVRRKEGGRWSFNPELMTLVTAAMSEPPTTPGGEPFGLPDLLAVDPQVTFDNVARRVTRLKLFTVLAAVRTFRQGEQIDADEPVLHDPNALLRRLVRDEKLTPEALLDPWGGTIQFVRTNGAAIPFLTVTKGYSLQSPGPDGRIATADDVRDPFERVVRGGTPYATAMGEDEIVDARWDMRVGEATVSGWQEMFARLTGTSLGSGSGSGSGQGMGSGHGRLGGSHTTKAPTLRYDHAIATDSARWLEPVRTDAQGRVKLRVPLGDYETTWRIALLARSDVGKGAVSTVDVATFLPVSAHVDIGRKLTAGDDVSARIIVRNRTPAPRSMALEVSGEGGIALAPREPRVLRIEVPPNTVRSVFARFNATAVGVGKVVVVLRSAGLDSDRTSHEVRVEPAGEQRVLGTAWASSASGGRATLRVDLPPGYAARGNARLVLESGVEDALLAALDAAEPDPRMPPEALADTIEIAARIEKHAEGQGKHWLVTRTRRVASFARAYLAEHERAGGSERTELRARMATDRARLFARPEHGGAFAPPSRTPPSKSKDPKEEESDPTCPKEKDLDGASLALFLESEPSPTANGPLPCFTTLIGKLDSKAPIELARASLALFDRPHRAPAAATTAQELARMTRAEASTGPAFDGPRADRAIIFAALARSAWVWSKDPKAGQRLIERMSSLRDARGGYGSSEATRDAVRALLSLEQGAPRPAHVTVLDGKSRHVVDVAPNGSTIVPLGADTRQVSLEIAGGPLVARLERPALRTFLAPPETSITPVSVAVEWPNDAKAGSTSVVHVTYKAGLGRNIGVWTRLPLPPGVTLAAPVKNVVQRQGILHLRTTVGATETVSLPVRFSLPGKVLVPEAETRTTTEELPRSLTPARSLTIRP